MIDPAPTPCGVYTYWHALGTPLPIPRDPSAAGGQGSRSTNLTLTHTAGPLALVAYYRWGRPATSQWQNRHGAAPDWDLAVTAALETIPGGAASFIGHLIAVPIVVGTGVTIAGKGVWPMILLIAAFALPLLIAFEYRSLTRMGQIRSAALRLRVALKISLLAILAFDTGMGVTMLIVAFVLGYPPTTIAFWFVMWGGLLLGFMTAYPMVRWLLGRGVTTPVESE